MTTMTRFLDYASDATDFERMLLGSANLDAPPAGVATALLDRLGGAPAPVVSFAEERKKRRTATWVFFIAAALGVAIVVFDRTRPKEHVVITQETATVPTPSTPSAPLPVAAPQQPADETPSASTAPSPPPPPPPVPSAKPKAIVRLPAASASMRRLAAPPGPGTPFDKGAAARALAQIEYQSCATSDGPVGSGHVTVTFENDGTASLSKVDDSTFPGTAVGACIAGKFHATVVPPFDGSSVRVGKTFTIK